MVVVAEEELVLRPLPLFVAEGFDEPLRCTTAIWDAVDDF